MAADPTDLARPKANHDSLQELCGVFSNGACAPGVCTPTWGGITSREGLAILQGLAGLEFVGFDVNTVSPPHDLGGMTAFLAGTVMLEFLYLACQAPSLAQELRPTA